MPLALPPCVPALIHKIHIAVGGIIAALMSLILLRPFWIRKLAASRADIRIVMVNSCWGLTGLFILDNLGLI